MFSTVLWSSATIYWLSCSVFVQSLEFCGQWDGLEVPGAPYSFNNDAWGDDGSGFSCMTVDNASSTVSVEWSWTSSPYDVHGFPHISTNSPAFPCKLRYVSALNLRAKFSSYLSSDVDSPPSTQLTAIQSSSVRSNIAVDMFADPSPTTALANTTTRPSHEIMIWLSQTQSIHPVGDKTAHWFPIANTTFTLWSGQNPHGQTTFSWLAPLHSDLEAIDADYSLLLHYLWQASLLPSDLYLGALQFGSEVFYSGGENVTFEASGFEFQVVKNETVENPPLQIPSGSGAAAKLAGGWLISVMFMVVGAFFGLFQRLPGVFSGI